VLAAGGGAETVFCGKALMPNGPGSMARISEATELDSIADADHFLGHPVARTKGSPINNQ
jgi:hypothetical protein